VGLPAKKLKKVKNGITADLKAQELQLSLQNNLSSFDLKNNGLKSNYL
jgi:hypothetical protein